MPWRNIKTYKYPDDYTAKDWGWEFIKRDRRYQEEWQNVFLDFQKTRPAQALMPFYLAQDVSAYSSLPPGEEINLTQPDKIDTFMIPSSGAEKWGLAFYQDPKVSRLRPFIFLPVKARYIDEECADIYSPHFRGDTISTELQSQTLVVVIDLNKAVVPQIKYCKFKAQELQGALKKKNPDFKIRRAEEVNKADRDRWIRYLRCIDADQADANRQVAANIILAGEKPSPEKKWDNTFIQINEIAEEYYSLLMF